MLSIASSLLKQHIRPTVSLPQPPCPASSYTIPLSPQLFPFSKLKLQEVTIICRRGNLSSLCLYACFLCFSFPGQLWLLHHPRISCPSMSLHRRLCVSPPHDPSKLICYCALTIREGNGNPLQYSCLENPVDRGAWWAAVHRVTQSRTRLKWISMHAHIGEGNGNPLQYSCLEDPRDRGARWATVHQVAKSQTRLSDTTHTHTHIVIWLQIHCPCLQHDNLSIGTLWRKLSTPDANRIFLICQQNIFNVPILIFT